jgi:hypothetical protein
MNVLKNLSRKTIFAILLIGLGLGFGLMVFLTYTLSGGSTPISLAFLATAVVFILGGTILAFSKLLDRFVNPVVEEIHGDIQDDLQDLKAMRITNTLWMVIITLVMALVFSFFVLRFHKVEARWGAIPVILPAAVGLAALAWFIPRTSWFQSAGYTPFWIFLIPTIGLVLTLWIGLAKTENVSLMFASRSEAVDYNIIRPASFFLLNTTELGGLSLDMPDCDGDACAVVLVIGLIILVCVLVIGSAMIPHFWLLSGSLMLCMMALIAIHDLRIRQSIKPAVQGST